VVRKYKRQSGTQLELPLGTVRNSFLFSSHWLQKRLPLEPEWKEFRDQANTVYRALKDLWKQEGDRVGQYGNESSLEYAFIQPVLEALGWKLIYQTNVRGRKPDYALFLDEEMLNAALAAGKESTNFWDNATLVADAKAWERPLDRPTRLQSQREYPPEQLEWYLNNSLLDYGILTNGRIWRLIPRLHSPDQPRFQTYLECDLPGLLERSQPFGDLVQEEFFWFYLFFSTVAHRAVSNRTCLIERARNGSSEYRLGIGRDLRNRVFEALRLCIQGFLRFDPNKLNIDRDLELCREQSLVFLYRLLFVMYAEDRQLLPYHVNQLYTNNRALSRYREEIATRLDALSKPLAEDFSHESTNIWDDLISLFDLIDSGHKRYGVPAYNGGLFNPTLNRFLTTNRIGDWHLARIIDQLGRANDKEHLESGLYPVDYRDLQIQHLGNIYEGLLELRPYVARERLEVIRPKANSKRQQEKTIPAKQGIPSGYESTGIYYEPTDVYLLTNKGERRATGSYYTPDHIVNYIVEEALSPVCKQVDAQLRKDIEQLKREIGQASAEKKGHLDRQLENLEGQYDDRILQLRILDPAMGSGHFLLRACQYLAEEIATHPYASDPALPEDSAVEPALIFWKRRVVENCIYGVDRNPLAVELAKLAVWLETVSVGRPLTFVDHHLRHGNSLVGARVRDLGSLPGEGPLFDFTIVLGEELENLLHPLKAIKNLPSDSSEQVKTKEQLYREFLRARKPFLDIANLWCMSYYVDDPSIRDRYREALLAIRSPSKFKKLMKSDWFINMHTRAVTPNASFFHWELEFPEVFLAADSNGGFDAIVGNPPYDVLSEKEIGYDISSLKQYVEEQELYGPSRHGKNNLYKLFVCRSVDLLGDNGYLGFITPMAILGDEQAVGVRRLLLGTGALISVDAFPQKDDPKRRVFPEAKLSTAIVVFHRTEDKKERAATFLSRNHPENQIDDGSPSLHLTTKEIPLYDASNLSIVCCSQEDWDLAVRIMNSGRMTRLREYSSQYQGEVNETNERARGSLSKQAGDGPLILRGSNVCLYVLRDASQGESLYLKVPSFLRGKRHGSKAYDYKQERVGFQRSSPQNNFRRIIASYVKRDSYCFDTVSYVRESDSDLPLHFVLALLNSKLLDWYFRLGSTNSKVNEYQFENLPCPVFAEASSPRDDVLRDRAFDALERHDTEEAFSIVEPLLEHSPLSLAVQGVVMRAVMKIVDEERDRGDVRRRDRSKLAPDAQPMQHLIDRILFRMAGLTDAEVERLEARLEKML